MPFNYLRLLQVMINEHFSDKIRYFCIVVHKSQFIGGILQILQFVLPIAKYKVVTNDVCNVLHDQIRSTMRKKESLFNPFKLKQFKLYLLYSKFFLIVLQLCVLPCKLINLLLFLKGDVNIGILAKYHEIG